MSTHERKSSENPALPAALPATVPLGPDGDVCRECRAPLASDQRYCLACGLARADARVELESLYAPAAPQLARETVTQTTTTTAQRPARGPWGITPFGLVAGVGGAACTFLTGLVLGLVINSDDPQPVAQQPPVVNITQPAAAAAPAAPVATPTPEPTVDPAAAATPEPEVPEEPKEDPEAESLGADELEAQENADPEEFQKNSKKLDKAATEGEPPPPDDEAAGGGGEGVTFE